MIEDSGTELENCLKSNGALYRIAVLLTNSEYDDNKVKSCLNLEKNNRPNEFLYKKIKFWLTNKELELIQKVHEKIDRQKKFYDFAMNIDLSIDVNSLSSINKNKIYSQLEKLSTNKSVLSKLLQIHIYQKLHFNAKAESIMNSIFEEEFIENFFREEVVLSLEDNVNEKVIELLLKIEKDIPDKELFSSLISYLSYGVGSSLRDLIAGNFNIPNRLSYVQKRIKSVHYGTRLPFVWTPWIEKFSSTEELKTYLNKAGVLKNIQEKPKLLATLMSYFPMDSGARSIIIKAYMDIKETKDPYLSELSVRILTNEKFTNELINRKLKSKKPLVLQKRKVYRELLNNNEAILYPIYNLLKIGDVKREYFIYLLGIKSYGL